MDDCLPSGAGAAVSGRLPLAVVIAGAGGLVSHWSSRASHLFGVPREDALGSPVLDLLPVFGALPTPEESGPAADGPLSDRELDTWLTDATPEPAAGRARLPGPGNDSLDVLWWAYPLIGPGPERLLVLVADAARAEAEHRGGNAAREQACPGFAGYTEFPEADLLARRLPDILPNTGPAAGARIVAQVLDMGYPVLELRSHERIPVTPDWGVPKYLARKRRTPQRVGLDAGASAATDMAAQEALDLEHSAVRERLEFLNEVSGHIGTSLDLEVTIREVTSAAVPRFADFAGTHLRAQVLAGDSFPDGPPDVTTVWHRVWVEHNDEPGRWDDTVPVGEAIAFPEHTPFFQCMVTGEPVLIPHISDELGDRIAGQFEKRDLRPLINGRSILIVPLKARQVVLGFMVLLRRPGRQPFNDMDRTTGAELAARAGLVLDNARMYTRQENVAETLQEEMLPRVSPRMPGCDVTTRYLPGTRLGKVGGDWFDTITLPGSRLALVVGDVMGHGLNSAVIMGQLRTAVQTLASLDLSPAQLLRRVDDLAQRLGENYLATCLYAVYDPVASTLRIANAGHIPPVVVRAVDGSSELLAVPSGAPIGVGGVAFEEVSYPVAPGDRVVLCTDGLVEVRGQDIGAGLAALCESAAHPAASMDDACDAIIRTLNPAGGRKDDVALLMARLNGIPRSDVVTWRLAPQPGEAARARALVREVMHRWGAADRAPTAELLVGELVTNAVRHARTERIELRLVRTDTLLCQVSDDDPAAPVLLDRGPESEYGRGLRIVDRLAHKWGTNLESLGKTVWFEQLLSRADAR
ncbi:SpoIIE family protein phosphatase [Streptomyces violens]|uniref:SpoIIE family protein phosphatase n=1 Tax=Streptomyces violens TaxID=66377 RepID=UPI0004BF3809|nr:SpoIIE family protein phosphatase [Streptomyces violens]